MIYKTIIFCKTQKKHFTTERIEGMFEKCVTLSYLGIDFFKNRILKRSMRHKMYLYVCIFTLRNKYISYTFKVLLPYKCKYNK